MASASPVGLRLTPKPLGDWVPLAEGEGARPAKQCGPPLSAHCPLYTWSPRVGSSIRTGPDPRTAGSQALGGGQGPDLLSLPLPLGMPSPG